MLVSPSDIVAKAKATIKECTVSQVDDYLTADTLMIDIREFAEFARGRIPGAIHISRGLLEFEIIPTLTKLGMLDDLENREIILYCGTGGRSALAAHSLDAMGFRNVRSLDGGIVAWSAAKKPLDTTTV